MARFNEILVGRFARSVQKLFGTKGGPPTPQLAGDVTVSHPFFSGRENRYLESWESFMFGINVLAQGAGNNPALRIRNPAGSNVVAVIEKAFDANNTAAALSVQLALLVGNNADLGSTNTGIAMDTRTRKNSTAVISGGISVNGSPQFAAAIGVNAFLDYIVTDIQEILLMPGNSLELSGLTANVSQFFGFMWRERFLEDSERI